MMLPFGPMEPDRGGLDTAILTIARNCYPSTIGYNPMPGLASYTVPALPSNCCGFFATRDKVGAAHVFCGTTTKLYKLVANTWADYTRATGGDYNVAAGAQWQWTDFKGKVTAVNGTDANQIIDIDAAETKFKAQGGSPPVGRFVFTIGDFEFIVDANDRRRFMCSGINNPEHWTIGELLCDEFYMPDGGNIAGPAVLGTYGLIVQDGGAARRLIFVEGEPGVAWRMEEISGIKPAINGYSVIAAKNTMFYLAENGPHALGLDGSNKAIGEHRDAQFFIENCDQSRMEQFQGFTDPYSSRIYWAYFKSENSTVYDGLLGYDVDIDQFFFADIEAQYWGSVIVPGLTLEQLDTYYASLDAMDVSLDSRQFRGGRPTIGAIKADGVLALLTGAELSATWRVSPTQLVQGGRALVKSVDPKGIWGPDAHLELWIGVRENTRQNTVWRGPFLVSEATGLFTPRVSSRIFEFELRVSGTGWKHAQGLLTDEQADGLR